MYLVCVLESQRVSSIPMPVHRASKPTLCRSRSLRYLFLLNVVELHTLGHGGVALWVSFLREHYTTLTTSFSCVLVPDSRRFTVAPNLPILCIASPVDHL